MLCSDQTPTKQRNNTKKTKETTDTKKGKVRIILRVIK